jgi:2-aminoethylphosphonate dioxygenase
MKEDLCPHHKGFDRLIRGGRLQRCVERLLGEPAALFKEKINFKMPGGAGFEAHQDQQAGWSTATYPMPRSQTSARIIGVFSI